MKGLLALSLALSGAFGVVARDFDVREYGAVGNGKERDTIALQRAIDDCSSSGGGRVVLERGTFLTGTIELKSGVDLHVDVSATLLGSGDPIDYPEWNWKHLIPEKLPRGRSSALIVADQANNIAISGRGKIDSNGLCFVRRRAEENPLCPYERDPNRLGPPRVVLFAGCRNCSFTDFTIQNSPSGWTFYINDCDLVHFDRVNVLGGLLSPNIDGIHINCSRDVMVSNCRIETQDDAIVVRGDDRMLRTRGKSSERILFANCSLRSHCSAIRISYHNDAIVRSCVFSNLVINDSPIGIRVELRPLRVKFDKKGNPVPLPDGRPSLRPAIPSVVEDLMFSNIDMQRVRMPISVTVGHQPWTKCTVRNLRFVNVHARDGVENEIFARNGNVLEDFSFVNCALWTREPFELKNCKGFRFDETTFNIAK